MSAQQSNTSAICAPSQLENGLTIGVLLTNVGSPDAPTARAVRPYLAQFLGDPRVIELPAWWWKPVLHGIILQTRPRKSARLYNNIWTDAGSPLIINTRAQVDALQASLDAHFVGDPHVRVIVAMGMRYGSPSIAQGLEQLRAAGANRLLILPMFPQYSATTTATSLDAVFDALRGWRWIPDVRSVNTYYNDPVYIEAIARSIEAHWRANGRAKRILFSYHGIPEAYIRRGDPYQEECYATTDLLVARLQLEEGEYGISFQSRLGPVRWLSPYTDETLEAWGKEGVESVEAICPGFTADCLETTDEVAREGGHIFQSAGGGTFTYIPSLNASPDHIDVLQQLALTHMQGWLPQSRQTARTATNSNQ